MSLTILIDSEQQFGIKKINSMKYVGLRVSKVPSSDWKLKLLLWFNIILYSEMCFRESVTILPLSLKLHRC